MTTTPELKSNQTGFNRFTAECAASCQKLINGIAQVRRSILTEVRSRIGLSDRMARLALNEAEALAWQTDYPHLLFPALALEKVQSAADWNRRQQNLRRDSFRFAH